MYGVPLTTEELQEAVDAFRAHPSKTAAAEALGLERKTFTGRLKVAAERGMLLDEPPAMPGFRITRVNDGPHGKSIEQKPEHGEQFQAPKGHTIKGVSALVDGDGREIVKWVKTKEGVLDPLEVAEQLKKSFDGFKPIVPLIPEPISPEEDLLTVIPCNDWHLGMFCWGEEVGENWDLKIAEERIGQAIEDTIARSPSSSEAIVLVGGDLLHADNKDNQTSKSKNQLDVDGRYQKVIDSATRLMVQTTNAALRRHGHVTVRVLPGNHDEHSAVAVTYFLKAWYRNEPRVTVDADPSLFFWYRFGQVLIGSTHGHTVKIKKMPAIMANRRAVDWGATSFRYVHGFHLHHAEKIQDTDSGCICEIHEAPIPQDAWHYGAGFLSGRSLQAITYHRQFGETGRVRVAMLDAAPLKEAA
jgi:hypothetical protein